MSTVLLVSACGSGKPSAPASAPEQKSAPAAQLGAPEKAKVVLAVGGAECLCYLPTTLAYHMGFFKEQGIEVDLQDFKGGSKALEALVGGSADVVSGYYEHTIRMQVKNKRITSFVNFSKTPGLILVVGKQAEGKIKSPKDLKGMKVGVSAPGSATHALANYLLTKNGLTPADISVIGIGLGPTAVAAFEQGSVDAAVLADPTVTQLRNRGLAKILVDTRTEADTQMLFGGPYAAGTLYASTEFLEKNPNTAQRMANAIVMALDYITTHSAEDVASKLPEAFYGGDKALYVETLKAAQPSFTRDGMMTPDSPKNVLEVLAVSDEAVSAAKAKVDLAATYTNRFAEKAAKH